MKKLSVLIALFMCVTIGGVYATWTYAGTTDITDGHKEIFVTIPDAVVEGTYGTYLVEANFDLVIDDTNKDHIAELVFLSKDQADPKLKVTFTPNEATATPAIKANAVDTELYFTTTTTMQYKMDAEGNYSANGTGVNIFTFKNPGNGTLDNVFDWTKQDDGTFTYELDLDDLKEQISLTQDFLLDSKSEHDAFREAMVGNIVARVTDGTIN